LAKPAITKQSVRGQIRWTGPDIKVKPYEVADIYPGSF
jgi:hypothetical protein